MFDHVSIRSKNFSRAFSFYEKALAPLGWIAQHVDKDGKSAGFGPSGAVHLWLSENKDEPTHHLHLAICAPKKEAIAKFYEAAIEAGGKDNGKPGPRPDYSATYNAAFVFDPDGNNIEAMTP